MKLKTKYAKDIKMIPINEIRVNNWFNLEFVGPFQWECSHFDEYVKDKAKGYDVEGCVVSDKVEPIALTPEVLEKCGFEFEYDRGYYLNVNDFSLNTLSSNGKQVQLFMPDSYGSYNCGFERIESLHQLQNCFYCLTGEELTVNL